jgi:hypothetical protein
MLTGAASAFTRRPIVEIAQRDRIDAIRSGGQIRPAAFDGLIEPRGLVADIAQIEIGARIDDDRHDGRPRRLARGPDPVCGVHQAADRHRAAQGPVLEIDPHGAGLDDFRHRAHDFIRRLAVTRLDVGGDRHPSGAHDAGCCGNNLVPRRLFAVGIAERPGNTAAGRRDRIETGGHKDPRAQRIPGVRQQQQPRPAVLVAKQLRLLRLFWPVHLAAPSKWRATRGRSLVSRTIEVKPTIVARLMDRNAAELCLKTLMANSRKFPEDSLLRRCRPDYTELLAEI